MNGGFGEDTIWGGDGADILNGREGNDRLLGQVGADDFDFYENWGQDVIGDFSGNAGEGDAIYLLFVTNITDFTDLQTNHLTTNGDGDVVIFDGANTITLVGVTLVVSSDFVF